MNTTLTIAIETSWYAETHSVEPPNRERFGTGSLCSLFRGCLLSEVIHFYHATAPNYSVCTIIHLFIAAHSCGSIHFFNIANIQ